MYSKGSFHFAQLIFLFWMVHTRRNLSLKYVSNSGLSLRYPKLEISATLILAGTCLTLNNFSFDSSHILQVKGVAVDTCMAPSNVCVFIGFIELSLSKHTQEPTVVLHAKLMLLRYINDLFWAACFTNAELVDVIIFTINLPCP